MRRNAHRHSEADFLAFMEMQISEKNLYQKCKTALNYGSAYRSFVSFLRNKERMSTLKFSQVTSELIRRYEFYLIEERKIRRNSSSFYIRILRAVFHKGLVYYDLNLPNPFRSVYAGVDTTVKRAVDVNAITKLIKYQSENEQLNFTKDAFLFCFLARGMAFIDFVKLQKSDCQNGRIIYRRSKTRRLLSIKMNTMMVEIINRYADPKSEYLFPVLKTPTFSQLAYEKALQHYNYHLRKLAEEIGVDSLTSYVARHSWATQASRLHIPTRVISESMGHSNERVTAIYLASLDNHEIDMANKKVLDKIKESLVKKEK
jgi:integrase